MIRRTLVLVIALTMTALGFAADDPKPTVPDEPPALLKKKKKPDAAPEEKPASKKDDEAKPKLRPKDKDADPKEEAAEPGTNPKEVLERIAKNIRDSEERLRKQDAGEGTRQVQRDVVKDIDKLIERMKQQQQNPQNGQSSSSSSPDSKSGSQQQQSSSSRSRRSERERQGKRDGQAKNQTNPDSRASAGGSDIKTGATPKADILKDVWGHLPEMMRLEMDAYSREQFAAKYGEMLKQYYQTIAEKGRRTERER